MSASRAMRTLARHASLATLVAVLGACSWFTDFKEQPKHDPWESADSVPMRGNPQNSVSVYGSAAPGYAVSRMALPGTVDSMKSLANPTPADARSLLNGRKYYTINCAVCHGFEGKGDGSVTKFGMPGIALVGPGANAQVNLSDGYIWGMMRNGRGLMPSYNRIEELDRWDVVNYIRGLQGRYQVVTGPIGLPGETGDKVPGFSQMGPTRASPWYGAHGGSPAGPSHGARDASGATSPTPMSPDTTHVPVDPIMPGPNGPAPRVGVPIPNSATPKTGGER